MWLPLAHQLRTWPATQACAPDWELNRRPFDSQAGTQPLSHTSQGMVLVFNIIFQFLVTVQRYSLFFHVDLSSETLLNSLISSSRFPSFCSFMPSFCLFLCLLLLLLLLPLSSPSFCISLRIFYVGSHNIYR